MRIHNSLESSRSGYNGLMALVGVWLILSPFVLGLPLPNLLSPENIGSLTFIVIGLVTIVTAMMAIVAFQLWEEWLDLGVGILLLISPWIFGFDTNSMATLNALVSAGAIIFCALAVLYREATAATY